MKRQPTKSITFFLELMIVICFFTISAGICVMVMSNAYEKSREADDIKKALLYGQNIIEQRCDILYKDAFQMNEEGNIVTSDGVYDAKIEVVKESNEQEIALLKIYKNGKEISALSFYREEGQFHVCK